MTISERKELLDAWLETSQNVIMMVGAESQLEAIELSEYTSQKVDSNSNMIGTAVMPSSFFKPSTTEELLNFIKPIAAASYPLPIKYYHVPTMTNVNLDMVDFITKAIDQIPNFSGIKFTNNDLFTMRRCVNIAAKAEKGEIFFGVDEILIAGLSMGAKSAVGSTYNFMGPTAHDIHDKFMAGDVLNAIENNDKIVNTVDAWSQLGLEGIPAQKAIMKMSGIDLGNVRSPLTDLSEEQYSDLKEALDDIGFFGFQMVWVLFAKNRE